MVMMLTAGAISCLFTTIRGDSLIYRMTALLGSMVFFYGMGQVFCTIMDYFDRENEKSQAAKEEIIEKDSVTEGDGKVTGEKA